MNFKNKSYEEQFTELSNKMFDHIKDILRKAKNNTIQLTGNHSVTIDPDNEFLYTLTPKTIKLVNDNIALFASDDEKEIADILNYKESNGYLPDECWFEGSDWLAGWEGLCATFDEIVEKYDTDYR